MIDEASLDPDIILFDGGADINPELYGEKQLPGTSVDFNRDKYDLSVYKAFEKLPKIGVCRGGQFLNVMNGGAMWQHVSGHTGAHELQNLLKVPELSDFDKPFWVTSTHHQMMIPHKTGEVIAVARPYDGKGRVSSNHKSNTGRVVPKHDTEVVWYDKTRSLCYQPHPEFMQHPSNEAYFFKLLDYFFN